MTTRLWSGTLDLTGATDPLRVVVEELEPGLRDEAGVPVAVENVVFIDVFELEGGVAPADLSDPQCAITR